MDRRLRMADGKGMSVGFFGDYRATRRDERELGEGVWRRAHDRFKRGLDRYHQILESVRDPALRAAAVPVANELADLLPRVRAVCAEAHFRAPSQTQDIPHSTDGYLSDVHRQLSRAGNSMAQTAEALTMARFSAPQAATEASEPDTGPTPPGAADCSASAPGALAAPRATLAPGVESVLRRSGVVEEYVVAAETLMAKQGGSRS